MFISGALLTLPQTHNGTPCQNTRDWNQDKSSLLRLNRQGQAEAYLEKLHGVAEKDLDAWLDEQEKVSP